MVSQKEGNCAKTVADLHEFWNGEKEIVLMDSNITASKDCKRHFDALIKSKAIIDFEGGLDIRYLTEDGCDQLNRMKISYIHFAWDNYEFKTYDKLKKLRPLIKYDHRKVMVYVLTNFNTTHEQDLERIYKLRELDYDPFVMIYDKPNSPRETRLLQRWVNIKFVFWSVEKFDDYDNRKA